MLKLLQIKERITKKKKKRFNKKKKEKERERPRSPLLDIKEKKQEFYVEKY